MGEYARFEGRQIQIGTCRTMSGLRAGQATLVVKEPGSLDPVGNADRLLFRFPFPDEDQVLPGDFEDYDRAVVVPGLADLGGGAEHRSARFVAGSGHWVVLPCPMSLEGKAGEPKVWGHPYDVTAAGISHQRVWNGHLALVCQCTGCGVRYRLEELEDAKPVIEACRWAASFDKDPGSDWWSAVADRIEEGYAAPLPF